MRITAAVLNELEKRIRQGIGKDNVRLSVYVDPRTEPSPSVLITEELNLRIYYSMHCNILSYYTDEVAMEMYVANAVNTLVEFAEDIKN